VILTWQQFFLLRALWSFLPLADFAQGSANLLYG
jgi:hypothetical protein